jgi:hypothetical protein
MSNSYSMEYGYQSLIYPARMFKTREDAKSFDSVQSSEVLIGPSFTRYMVECISNGTVTELDQENARVVLAALRWVVNAVEDAESEKRMEAWRKSKETADVDQPVEVE